MISKSFVNDSDFWNVSNEVLGKTEGNNSIMINEYLRLIPMLLRNVLLTYIVVESIIRQIFTGSLNLEF